MISDPDLSGQYLQKESLSVSLYVHVRHCTHRVAPFGRIWPSSPRPVTSKPILHTHRLSLVEASATVVSCAEQLTHCVDPTSFAYVPFGHAMHVPAVAAEYVPALQSVQTEIASCQNLPASQMLQTVAPALEYAPAPQSVQTEAPIAATDENLPASQMLQFAAPSSEYLPASQMLQITAAATEYVPALQLLQFTAPCSKCLPASRECVVYWYSI